MFGVGHDSSGLLLNPTFNDVFPVFSRLAWENSRKLA